MEGGWVGGWEVYNIFISCCYSPWKVFPTTRLSGTDHAWRGGGVGGRGIIYLSLVVTHLGKCFPPLGCPGLTTHARRYEPETHVGALRLKHSESTNVCCCTALPFEVRQTDRHALPCIIVNTPQPSEKGLVGAVMRLKL